MRTEINEENISYWLNLHGYVPWTVTIADHLKDGTGWPPEEVAKVLCTAQDKIDRLTEELVALKMTNAMNKVRGA